MLGRLAVAKNAGKCISGDFNHSLWVELQLSVEIKDGARLTKVPLHHYDALQLSSDISGAIVLSTKGEDAASYAELGLACSWSPDDLSQRPDLDASAEHRIELL